MAITIKGIRLKDVNIKPSETDTPISCSYQLISSLDKVLAEQTLGQYGGAMKVPPSSDTLKAMDQFLQMYKKDIQQALGLDTD